LDERATMPGTGWDWNLPDDLIFMIVSISRVGQRNSSLEHDAEKGARFSDNIMLYFFDSDQDSDFRPIGPKIILI
jgi:hypothetical protein